MLHFNARGPDGLLNGKSPGHPSKLDDGQRQAIARMIESGPSRELRAMGYRKLSARPRHYAQAAGKLNDRPWRIMSIGLRQWAHGF